MPNIKFKPDEKMFEDMQEAYNKLAITDYPDILFYNHHDLTIKTKSYAPDDWKEWLMHPKFQEWFADEERILLRTKATRLVMKSDESRSTGEAQALNQIYNRIDKDEEDSENEVLFIYSCVPLTEEEEFIPNVRTLDNIPPEIKDAMQKI